MRTDWITSSSFCGVNGLSKWTLKPAIVFALIGVLCSTLSLQALDLVNSLPKYRDNIHAKWAAIQQGPPGPLNLAFTNIGAAIADFSKVTASAEGNQKSEATKVQIVSGADSIVAMVKNSLTPIVGPIGEFAVVVVLVVFMVSNCSGSKAVSFTIPIVEPNSSNVSARRLFPWSQ